MVAKYVSRSLEDTARLARAIAGHLHRGDVLALDGALGAGKTTFTKFLGSALGIEEEISSPTFNILKCYFKGKMPLYHIDAYRLEEGINRDIGLEEVIEGDGIAVVEWADFIEDLLFQPLKMRIERADETTRIVTLSSDWEKYAPVFEEIEAIDR